MPSVDAARSMDKLGPDGVNMVIGCQVRTPITTSHGSTVLLSTTHIGLATPEIPSNYGRSLESWYAIKFAKIINKYPDTYLIPKVFTTTINKHSLFLSSTYIYNDQILTMMMMMMMMMMICARV